MATLAFPRYGITTSRLTRRLTAWLVIHRQSLLVVTPLLAGCSVIRFWNMTGTPGGWNDDEGTYVSQAWAVLHDGKLAHYTYWYDHPPFGWIQIAGWAWLTHGFERDSVAIMVGRELVTVYAVIGGGLMYLLCRRLGMLRIFSVFGMLLLMLSPIAQVYGRMVFLDTLAVPWVLAAMVAATYCRKSHGAALWAGAFLAGAVLTKETMLVFAPVVLWMIWQNSHASMRTRNLAMGAALTVLIGSFYILMAILKGELIPGPGHVSLGYALSWQLFGRGGGGSVLDSSSLSHQWFMRWMHIDWLLVAAAIPMLFVILTRRKLWPIALAALLHMCLLVRSGYLPIPFVIILIPIAALVVAGGLDTLWQGWQRSAWTTYLPRVVSIGLAVTFIVAAAPSWYHKTASNLVADDMKPERMAVAWIVQHAPASAHKQIVVDDNVWPDLIDRGYTRTTVDWFYKLDVDPAVMPRYVKHGTVADAWKSIDYVVIPPLDQSVIDSRPTLAKAIKHAKLVANFAEKTAGSYEIFQVQH